MSLAAYLRKRGEPRLDRVAGIVWGCAVGDYVGVQVEFSSADAIRARYGPDGVTGPPDPASGLRGLIYDWSDDTDQLVLLMAALDFARSRLDTQKFAASLLEWKRRGFPELGDLCGAGLGQYTARLLEMPKFLEDPRAAAAELYAETGKKMAANGAVMRAGIAAACEDYREVAVAQAEVTHADPRCVVSSWLAAGLCRHFLDNGADGAADADAVVRALVAEGRARVARTCASNSTPEVLADYDQYAARFLGPNSALLDALDLGESGAIGHTLKALGCAIWAAREQCGPAETLSEFYARAILAIVNRGGDTDTNAAVAGAVLGARVGYSAIGWQERLKHRAWLDKKVQEMLERLP